MASLNSGGLASANSVAQVGWSGWWCSLPEILQTLNSSATLIRQDQGSSASAAVLGMTAGSISIEGEVVFYNYRGNGRKTGRRELPWLSFEALLT